MDAHMKNIMDTHKLNPYLEELMVITMEECGELTQACSKIWRGSPSGRRRLLEEVGDVQCMINLIVENGLLAQEDVNEKVEAKREKLKVASNLIKDDKHPYVEKTWQEEH